MTPYPKGDIMNNIDALIEEQETLITAIMNFQNKYDIDQELWLDLAALYFMYAENEALIRNYNAPRLPFWKRLFRK
jgi:hypothetical protein